MFKAFGSALYKTPWWAIALMGLFVLTCLVVFSLPVQVIRLTESGATREESRAIQREIDRAFGDNALGFAERIVQSMRERTKDDNRRAELDQALEEIASARREIFDAAKEARRAGRETVKGAAEAARAAARTAAESARDAAREKIESLQEAREEALQAQKKVGIDDPAALIAFDKAIASARENEKAALDALVQLQSSKLAINLDFDAAENMVGIGPTPPKAPLPPSAKAPGATVEPPAPPLPPAPPSALTPEIREDIHRKVGNDFRRVGVGSALIVIFIPLFIVLLIAKYYIGRSRRAQALAQAKSQEAESANLNRQIVEAKLMALQAQVEPHFLYNTLANVQALTEVDPAQANQMTGHLIQYLRAALPKMRENASTIGQEVELVRAYLNILKMRMGDRLEFGIEMPTETEKLPFPPLMLPSLVENAIKHGLEPQREGGRIDVVVERHLAADEETLRVMVKDTGRGLSEAPVQAGGGVGLTNVRERLSALFGERARLMLESNDPKGVVATIIVPIKNFPSMVPPDSAAAAAIPAAAKPANLWGKAKRAASKTHSVWVRVLMAVLFGLMTILVIAFVLGMIAMATGLLPVNISGTTLTGLEGMAIGTAVLLLITGILAIMALFVVAVLYGLGFLFVGLAIGIPLIILISMFPVLLPFAVIFGIVYFFWWRKRKRQSSVDTSAVM